MYKNEIQETKPKSKYRERKEKEQFIKNLLTGIIIVLMVAFFWYANSVRQTNAKTADTIQGIRSEINSIRDSVQSQFNAVGGKLLEQDKKIEGVKQSKADQKQKQSNIQVANKQYNASGNCEQYRPLVAQYNWNVDVALAVMKAESNCNPNAIHVNSNGSVDHGLFQLNNINVTDPAQNIAIAYNQKYVPSHWSPWVVCTKGIVKCS